MLRVSFSVDLSSIDRRSNEEELATRHRVNYLKLKYTESSIHKELLAKIKETQLLHTYRDNEIATALVSKQENFVTVCISKLKYELSATAILLRYGLKTTFSLNQV